jgi:hypothetical protein
METFELITAYAKSKLIGYKALSIEGYTINGSVIKIGYSYEFDWSNDATDRSYDTYIEVELLDYITWVFNWK